MSMPVRSVAGLAPRAIAVALATLAGAAVHAGGTGIKIPVDKSAFEDDHLKKIFDGMKQIDDATRKNDDYYKDLDALSPEDEEYEPDTKPPGTPELPLLCKNSAECENCFKDHYYKLEDTRLRFEKLRRVNRVTKKMLRDAISFGDAAAGVAGGMAPLVWNAQKTRIRASEANFNATYDGKYEELLGTLKEALDGIAACEAEVFGEENWYERYGFVFQAFMSEAYRRPD